MLIFMDILMSNRSSNTTSRTTTRTITTVVNFNINDMRITFFIGAHYLHKIYQGANTRTVEHEEAESCGRKAHMPFQCQLECLEQLLLLLLGPSCAHQL